MKIFRLSGIALLLVVSLLVWGLLAFLAGDWIERGIEQEGSQINGATVSVASSRLGWWLDELNIESLAIANPSDLNRNRIEVGQLKFAVDLPALLKQQMHVKELIVADVKLNQPRPVPAQAFAKGAYSPSNWQWPKAVAAEAKAIDPSAVLQQVDIRSPQMFEQFSNDLTATQQRWEAQQAALPDQEKFDALKTKFQAAQDALKKAKGLEKVARAKALKEVVDEADQERKKIAEFRQVIKQDISALQSRWKTVKQQVDKDTQLAMSIINLTPEGMKHLAASFLGEDVAHWVGLALDNSEMLTALGNKKSVEQAKPTPRTGIDVNLTGAPPLPSVWIKNTLLSGDFQVAGLRGQLSGEAKNIASELIAGQPLTSNIKLTLPAADANAKAAQGSLALTLKKAQSGAALQGNVDLSGWPVANWSIGQGGLNLTDIRAQVQASVTASEANTKLVIDIQLTDFKVEKSNNLSKAMTVFATVLEESGVAKLTVELNKKGAEVDSKISSNLDKLFFAKIKDQFQAKADNAKAEIRNKIDAQVSGVRESITQRLSGLANLEQEVLAKLEQFEQLK
ncbi:MAG: TIGR03545 family protein [Gammaproteobacteria bacterium]|nr:TIGR03545 family protein [Gammaproteobacteria bacterium]